MELKIDYVPDRKGTVGDDGLAGRLAWENCGQKFRLEKEEIGTLRVGTHPRETVTLKSHNISLKEWLRQKPDLMGDLATTGIVGLPFIYQVHSASMPSSIRCHPNKDDNKTLRKTCPEEFPDRAVCELLVISIGYNLISIGTRPPSEIKQLLRNIPELTCIIPEDIVSQFIRGKKSILRDLLYQLFTASDLMRRITVDAIISRLEKIGPCCENAVEYYLFEKIHNLIPYDVGVFIPFFFNYKLLGPGEAIHVVPGTPYSLLFGNFISISTKSTNTAHVGMNCDFPNTKRFMQIADLNYHNVDEYLVPRKSIDLCTEQYKPLNSSLGIDRISIPRNIEYDLAPKKGCSVIQVTKGHVKSFDYRDLKIGSALLLPANMYFDVKAKEDTIIYRAYYDLRTEL